MLRRAIIIVTFLCTAFAGAAAQTPAELFPDTIYTWQKTREEVLPRIAWTSISGVSADLLEAYGVSEWRVAEYARAGRTARIDLASLPGRVQAFGLFRFAADAASPEGIVGDAFGERGSAVHVNYGPFYFRVTYADSRHDQAVDEALVVRTRRMLYGRADCYGSDFPLPTEERVIGSERFLPPDPRIWKAAALRGADDILASLGTRAAYVAEYRKAHAGVRRTLLHFPFRQKEAAAEFAAEMVQQLTTQQGRRSDQCVLPAFIEGNELRIVVAAPTYVLLLLTDVADAGACDWLRSVLR